MQKLILYPKAPYDFEKIIRRVQGVGHEMFHLENNRLMRTISVDGQVILLEITSIGEEEHPKIEVILTSADQIKESTYLKLKKKINKMLSIDVDLQPFYLHLQADESLSAHVQQLKGLHYIFEPDLFECMIKTIIGQQLNLSFASTLMKRLMEITTEPFVMDDDRTFPVFPAPEQIAQLNYEDLRNLQFSQRKAEYVIDLARAVVEGRITFEGLEEKSNEEIFEQLLPVRGIGRWTIECFLMFGLGREDILPAADIGLRNGIQKVYSLEDRPNEEQVRERGQIWSPWSSYTTLYFWEALNDKK